MVLLIVKYWKSQMIINDVAEPQKSLYVIGAGIISEIKSVNKETIDPIELFKSFEKTRKVSLTYFHFGLDWLYLLNLIELDAHGNIKLCN